MCGGHHVYSHILPGLVDIHRSFGSSHRGDRRIVKSIVGKRRIIRHRHMILPCGGLFKHQVQLVYLVGLAQIHLPPVAPQRLVRGGGGVWSPVGAPLRIGVPIIGFIGLLIGELGAGAGRLIEENVGVFHLGGLHPQLATGHIHIALGTCALGGHTI